MIDHDTIEATDLYAMVFSDDCKCESPHRYSICSIEVTHLSTAKCGPTRRICTNPAKRDIEYMAAGFSCADCGRLARDCWKVVAI